MNLLEILNENFVSSVLAIKNNYKFCLNLKLAFLGKKLKKISD